MALGTNTEGTKFTGEKPSLFLYGRVGLIALFKDLLDLVGIGSLPGIGTVVTLCLTFLIWILLTVFDRSSGGARGNMQITRGLVVMFFGLVEAIGFGLNFLPIETVMVFVLYILAKRAWKKEEKLAKKENRPSKSQLRQDRLNAVRQAKEARAQRQISEQQTEEPTQQPVDNEAKTMLSTPLKMMSDMKLPGNTVVPKQGVVSGEGMIPVTGAEVKSPQNSVLTEARLRERYEQPRRDVLAGRYRGQKHSERQAYNDRKKSVLESHLSYEEHAQDDFEYKTKRLEENSNAVVGSYQSEKEFPEQMVRLNQSQIDSRSPIAKLRYKVTNDPLKEEQSSHRETLQNIDFKIRSKQQETEQGKEKLRTERDANFSRIKQGTRNYLTGLEPFSNANNVERIHAENMASKEAIKNTLTDINSGNLDIAKLAKANNTVVVHSIPSPGWSMKNTSMNNDEIDSTNLSSAEKGRILVEKQPDVSASIVSASGKIEGQEMFYPFGFIVDGKLIASYEKDSGTVAGGDARRRKEMYHGTLQKDAAKEFAKWSDSVSSNTNDNYNESIVHKPVVRGILIDEDRLQGQDDYYPKKGNSREQAFTFSEENYPNQPVYIRKNDGIYTREGKKVTAEEIYSGQPTAVE